MSALGWIGLGIMGKSMCGHLLRAGHEVFVYTRTKASAQDLVASGAKWCLSPAEVAGQSEIVFSMVGYPADVRSVYLGENGLVSGAARKAILVDMTTSEPALAKEIFQAAKDRELESLDAPVSGGDLGAQNASLAIMVGGEQKTFTAVLPFFELMGKNIQLMGPAGAGQHTKMSNQILIAGTMIGVVESLLYAVRAGLDMEAVIDVIGSGAASSWSINNLGRRIAAGDFEPGFFVEHFVKDMGIALAESRKMGIMLPGLALVEQLYLGVMAQGMARKGTQALYRALQTMCGEK